MIGKSLGGLDIPLLTITNFDKSGQGGNEKKVVVVSARIHPGETHGSWVMHGFI